MAHAKGLRDRRVMTRYAGRNAILPPLNGFAALFASAVGGLVFVEYIFSYPGAGLTLQQAVLGNDYAARAGDARRALGLRDRREPDHGRPQPRPRPASAHQLMSQLDPTSTRRSTSRSRRRRDAPGAAASEVPGWLVLLLSNRKSRHGLAMVAFVVIVALIAPLITVARPERLQHPRRPPGAVLEPPVRDDRSGQRHLLAGRRRRPAVAAARLLRRRPRHRRRRHPRDHGRATSAGSSTTS